MTNHEIQTFQAAGIKGQNSAPISMFTLGMEDCQSIGDMTPSILFVEFICRIF